MNINDYTNAITRSEAELRHLNEELTSLNKARTDMPEAEYIRELNSINSYIAREEFILNQNKEVVNAYDSMRRNIAAYAQVQEERQKEPDNPDIQEAIRGLEAEIQQNRRILPEELQEQIRNEQIRNEQTGNEQTGNELIGNEQTGTEQTGTELIGNEQTGNEQTGTEQTGNELIGTELIGNEQQNTPKGIETPSIPDVQTKKNERQQQAPEIDLLADDFDPSKIPYDVFRREYRKAAHQYQNDPDKLKRLIDLNNQVQSKKRQSQNQAAPVQETESSDHSDIEFIPGTTIPKPRGRGVYESDEHYIEYLREYYERAFRKYAKELEKNKALLGLPDKSKGQRPLDLPAVVDQSKKLPAQTGKTKDPTPKPTPMPPRKETPSKKGLITIINELTKGLELQKSTGKKYTASNIKVSKQFIEELKSGNVLYNIVHVIPTIVKSVVSSLGKLYSKITLSKQQKQNMKTLQERIENMPEEDLMTVYNEYRGSRVIQERFPSAINVLLQQRIGKFALENLTRLNNENIQGYQTIFNDYAQVQALNDAMANPNITPQERQALINQKNQLLSGKIQLIQKVRDNYIEANQWMSGGEHGFTEDMKAAASKLSITGKRFAKDHDLNNELLEREAALEQAENNAIAHNNAEQAMKAFIGMEQLLSSETEIENSIFGKRSTGEKYYTPLAQQLDYRDDPFVRDIFTTMAVVGAGVSAYNAVKTHGVEADKILKDQQAEAQRVNDANNATMQQVNQTGSDIAGKRGDFMRGMKAQQKSDISNFAMTGERQTLDQTGWQLGTDTYHQADAAAHAASEQLYSSVESQIKNITNQYRSGSITQAQAMQEISNVSAQTQSNFQSLVSGYMPTLTSYAQSHPQFDLNGAIGALQYIQHHPNAIMKMNQAAIDTTAMGESLIGLSATQVQALQSLPSDMQTTLFGAASAGALAYNVAKTTQENSRRGKYQYGNEVTRMVEESMQQEAPEPVRARAA